MTIALGPQKSKNASPKEKCEAYLKLLKEISQEGNPTKKNNLQTKAENMFKGFTDQMKMYCKKAQDLDAIQAQMSGNISRLEEIDNSLQKMSVNVRQENEKLRNQLLEKNPPNLVRSSRRSPSPSHSGASASSSCSTVPSLEEQPAVSNDASTSSKRKTPEQLMARRAPAGMGSVSSSGGASASGSMTREQEIANMLERARALKNKLK